MHSGIESPPGVWWKPAHRAEKLWVAVAFGWCMVLFAMMPFWHLKGGQNPSGVRHTVDPQAFMARTQEFINSYQVGTEGGIPVVEPPAGSDIYLIGRLWQWWPILELERGQSYRFHISSLDWQHGFSLQPVNINIQVHPGYEHVITLTPTQAGEYGIICNEFCGIGHHMMTGKIYVTGQRQAEGGARLAEGR